nr:ABC transporter permease [Octadecabacter dasysiphoniae]
MMLREMGSRYGRTPGGYLWAVLEPLGMIVMLAIGFGLLLRNPPLGGSFIMFYATGHLVYTLFLRTNTCVMNALTYSRNLLAYPAVTWIDAVLARFILNVLTDLLVAAVLLFAIMQLVDHRSSLAFGEILAAFGLAALLGAGAGLMNCILMGFFPVWKNVWSIVTRPLFLASGVIWIYEELPSLAQDVLWWNPLVHITGLARDGFYGTYAPQHISFNLMIIPGLIMTALGLLLLRRYHLWVINAR